MGWPSQWIHVGPVAIDLTFRVDALTSLMLLIITGVGFLIHVYSLGYMDDGGPLDGVDEEQ